MQVETLVLVVRIERFDRIVDVVADRTVAIDQPARDIPEQVSRKSESAKGQTLSRRKASVREESVELDISKLGAEVGAVAVLREVSIRPADATKESFNQLSILAPN
jgi:hypothetical protein